MRTGMRTLLLIGMFWSAIACFAEADHWRRQRTSFGNWRRPVNTFYRRGPVYGRSFGALHHYRHHYGLTNIRYGHRYIHRGFVPRYSFGFGFPYYSSFSLNFGTPFYRSFYYPRFRTFYYPSYRPYFYSPLPAYYCPPFAVNNVTPAYSPLLATDYYSRALAGLGLLSPAPRVETPKAYAPAATDTDPIRFAALGADRRSKGDALMRTADEHFRNGRYDQAVTNYLSSLDKATETGEAYFRLGHSLIASRQYEAAAKIFRLGLPYLRDIDRKGFRLTDLYGRHKAMKDVHLDQLAQAALDSPKNHDLLYLIGLSLRYDGQGERANRFFREAIRLGAIRTHVVRFISTGSRPVLEARRR